MDSDPDTNSSQQEGGDPFAEFADRFMELVSNVVREPGQVVEVDLGDGCRLGASIHVDDGGHVVDEMRLNFSYRPTEDREMVEQGGIVLCDLQQLAGWLEAGHPSGARQGRVQRREQLRQLWARFELCSRCGMIHRVGACTGSRHEKRGGGGGGRRR